MAIAVRNAQQRCPRSPHAALAVHRHRQCAPEGVQMEKKALRHFPQERPERPAVHGQRCLCRLPAVFLEDLAAKFEGLEVDSLQLGRQEAL